jgi:VWFA-related protein
LEARSPAQQSSGYKVKVDVNSVFLNVSVRDRYNRSIARLRKEDFVVYEDGVPQEIQQFASEDAPFNTLLLLDNSGSTQPYLRLIKDAAIEFTRRIKPSDQVAVVAFNSLTDLMTDFTDYRPRAQRAIEKIESIGGTALYDSLLICIDSYMSDVGGRSAIVVFTDGFDNQLEGPNSEGSRTPFSQLYRRIQEIEPIIYTIQLDTGSPSPSRLSPAPLPPGLGWPPPWQRSEPAPERPSKRAMYETARQQLYMIAEQTGGRMYHLTSVENLSPAYTEIAQDLSARYQLAYNPINAAHDGRWRQIRVQVKGRPDAVTRTRKGYYATSH